MTLFELLRPVTILHWHHHFYWHLSHFKDPRCYICRYLAFVYLGRHTCNGVFLTVLFSPPNMLNRKPQIKYVSEYTYMQFRSVCFLKATRKADESQHMWQRQMLAGPAVHRLRSSKCHWEKMWSITPCRFQVKVKPYWKNKARVGRMEEENQRQSRAGRSHPAISHLPQHWPVTHVSPRRTRPAAEREWLGVQQTMEQ